MWSRFMKYILSRLPGRTEPRTRLGRWCLPTSEAYPQCNQDLKATLSNYDHGFESLSESKSHREEILKQNVPRK